MFSGKIYEREEKSFCVAFCLKRNWIYRVKLLFNLFMPFSLRAVALFPRLCYNFVYTNSRNRTEATPLLCASQEGHLASVVKLLQAGADPLLPDRNGFLPIHKAAGKNHAEVVKILIEKGGCSPDQVRHTALQSIDHLYNSFIVKIIIIIIIIIKIA